MEVVHPCCAGLDVHKEMVMACVRRMAGGKISYESRSFGTTTKGLLELGDWLEESECTHVAMEATGVFWKPVWHLLEDRELELVLANARHIKNVPGRKTDKKDAEWISDLLAHGLIQGSFVPPGHIQEVRDLTRARKQLVREKARHTQRIQKTLEDANLKLTSVMKDVLGVSGRRILAAIVGGETDPDRLASLALLRRMKRSREEIVEACRGRVTAHHRFLIEMHLQQIDGLDAAIRKIETRAGEVLGPFDWAEELLTSIPGISTVVAQVIVGEIGLDMSRFPSEHHLVSWACLCPRLDESAGKRRTSKIRKGCHWLKTHMVQAAWGAVRKKDNFLRAKFYRLRARHGSKKAIVAVAAAMLRIVYHVLRDGVLYEDLGADFYARRDQEKTKNRLVRRLEALGFGVELTPAA